MANIIDLFLTPRGTRGEEPATGLVPVVDCGAAARRMGALTPSTEGPHPSRAETGARHLPRPLGGEGKMRYRMSTRQRIVAILVGTIGAPEKAVFHQSPDAANDRNQPQPPLLTAYAPVASRKKIFPVHSCPFPAHSHPMLAPGELLPSMAAPGRGFVQSRSNSLIEVLERVFSSTVFTITAQYVEGPQFCPGIGLPGRLPDTTTE